MGEINNDVDFDLLKHNDFADNFYYKHIITSKYISSQLITEKQKHFHNCFYYIYSLQIFLFDHDIHVHPFGLDLQIKTKSNANIAVQIT